MKLTKKQIRSSGIEPLAGSHNPPATVANASDDGEHGLPEYKPRSYHRLAEIMSKDKNLAIFWRFDELNMLHLMALQAEIVELRGLFRHRCRQDDEGDAQQAGDHPVWSSDFHALRESETTQTPPAGTDNIAPENHQRRTRYPSSQVGLMAVLRQRMSEYSMFQPGGMAF